MADTTVQKQETVQQAEDAGAERPQTAREQGYTGRLVRRDHLLRSIGGKVTESGIVLIVAPDGFGKTALLIQYAHAAAAQRGREGALAIDGADLSCEELLERLACPGDALPWATRPLVTLDGIPRLTRNETKALAAALRALRDRGAEVVVACTPARRQLLDELSDAARIDAQALLVSPREYSEWVALYSIARTLDVYGLTEGIPALVACLESVSERASDASPLEDGIQKLYQETLDDLRRERDPLHRVVCMLLLMGAGTLGDLTHGEVKLRQETIGRLVRDYPMFNIDQQHGAFRCLTRRKDALAGLRRKIASSKPGYALVAARALARARRIDDAAALAQAVLSRSERVELIVQFPVAFALAGQGAFVAKTLAATGEVLSSGIETGALIAAYVSALTMGDYRLARGAAIELRRRATAIPQQVAPADWACARAVAETWESVSGIALPDVREPAAARLGVRAATLLRAHVRVYDELVAGTGDVTWGEDVKLLEDGASANEIDIPRLLLLCDRYLDDIMHGKGLEVGNREALERLVERLMMRRMAPIAVRVRCVVNMARLFAGDPVVDERGFVDAGTTAVRESDLPTQLLCLAAEGWQGLAVGQAINGQFRGQQVIKLAGEDQVFLHSWGTLLERVAHLRGTSRVKVREEAETLDLSEEDPTPARAWCVALHLAAARFDSELSAWYSLHKDLMLEARFRPCARLAMSMLGSKADSMRKLLPRTVAPTLVPAGEPAPAPDTLFEVVPGGIASEVGQVVINLFGGFQVERNGHTLTQTVWRRKKASVLAARLALSLGTFVSRRTIIDELWPKAEYARGRESLYVTLSALRSAMGQRAGGPQYVLTQGEGIALNGEFVYSDTKRFEGLAREILLSGDTVPAQQIVEAALKMEQIYRGPLYLPDSGDASFFANMRRAYLSRYIDCMMRGVDAALRMENLNSAAWLVEAALKQAPTREDVIRHAMTVFDQCGRRREVVELYNSHLHYLERELSTLPEQETREAYDRIINQTRRVAML